MTGNAATPAKRLYSRLPLSERLWLRVDKDSHPEGCWLWTGAKTPQGYGSTWDDRTKRTTLSHRVAYELMVGPIPDGLHLDHLCRNRICCNPSHLEAVTPGENIRRGQAPSAVANRAGMCRKGLHRLSGANLFVRRNGWQECRTCAQEATRRRYVPKSDRKRPEPKRYIEC